MQDVSSIILISDIHGCYKSLLALIAKLPSKNIVFCGDLIDRGPDSKSVIQYAIDNNIPCIRGNHEQMLLEKNYHIWMLNGGISTIGSYGLDPANPDMTKFREIAKEHLEWMEKLPYYLDFPNLKNDRGQYLIMTHAALLGPIQAYDKTYDLLWNRRLPVKSKESFNVFGHTPVMEPFITKYYASIDTGCAYSGKLTALQFPQMKLFHQENID